MFAVGRGSRHVNYAIGVERCVCYAFINTIYYNRFIYIYLNRSGGARVRNSSADRITK